MSFEITDSACNRIAELVHKESINSEKILIGLRVSVNGGGCSGFMYSYELVGDANPDDLIIEKESNFASGSFVKIIIDPVSYNFLDGSVLNFIQELGASYFQITNPNATAKCGCGNSFAV